MSTSSAEKPGCLKALTQLFGQRQPTVESLPYEKKDYLLSRAELSFYHVLRTALNDQLVICPKVRMTDVLYVKNRRENFNFVGKIAQKHIDFLLCDPKQMRPVVALELDDRSHERSDRQERDAFVDRAFAEAGLPILHIQASRTYHTDEIRALIKDALKPSQLEQTSG